jgi:hypothetical protein
VSSGELRALWRAVWRLGIRGRRRLLFWRLVAKGLVRGTDLLPSAVTFAIVGEDLIRYTEEIVLPRMDATLAAHDATREGPEALPLDVAAAASSTP